MDENSRNGSVSAIGQELVAEARARPDSGLPLSTQIYPYALVASRRMSGREISSWLREKHRIQISAVAISKALRSPEIHLRRLADRLSSLAEYIALVAKCHAADLLRVDPLEECDSDGAPSQLEGLAMRFESHVRPDEEDLAEAVEELRELWERMPLEVRLLLARDYLWREEAGHDPDFEDRECEDRP